MTSELAAPSPSLLPVMLQNVERNSEDQLFDVKDNLTGIPPRIPQVEIVHCGQLFRVKGTTDTPFQEFHGVVVFHHNSRAFFSKPMAPNVKMRPDCASRDGITGEPGVRNANGGDSCPIPANVRPQNTRRYGYPLACVSCPMNAWGSDLKGGRGKACAEKHRLFVLPTDPALASTIPYLLIAPPSSLKGLSNFFSMLTSKNTPHQIVIVTFSLKKLGEGATEYAELVLETDPKQQLNRADQLIIKGLINRYGAAFTTVSEEPETEDTQEPGPAPAIQGARGAGDPADPDDNF